jgi:hypothetical protein
LGIGRYGTEQAQADDIYSFKHIFIGLIVNQIWNLCKGKKLLGKAANTKHWTSSFQPC